MYVPLCEPATSTLEDSLLQWRCRDDPALSRLSPEERGKRACAAMVTGRVLAVAQGGRRDPESVERWVRELGIRVSEEPTGRVGGMLFRATYQANPPTITLYGDGVARVAEIMETLQWPNPPRLARAVSTAHEIFHHLQLHGSVGSPGHEARVTVWRLGPIHKAVSAASLDEVAAAAFAQELLGLPALPLLLDHLAQVQPESKGEDCHGR